MMFCQDTEKIHVMVKHPDMQLHLKYSGASLYEEPEVIHKTRRRDRNVSKEDFLQEREGDTGKNNRGKLKKKVQ